MTDELTKVELLTAICETPGWSPSEDSSRIDRSLQQLQAEGWILPRLDGWEATPRAVESYPHFAAATDGTVHSSGPPRNEMGRPEYELPQVPPEWDAEHTLDPIVIGPRHQVNVPIEFAHLGVKGGIGLTSSGERVEAEVTVKLRKFR